MVVKYPTPIGKTTSSTKKAKHAEQFGKAPEGKEAMTEKGVKFVQRLSLSRKYTEWRQMRYTTLVGAASVNLGLRVYFTCHISYANLRMAADHMIVRAQRDKTDQSGEKVIDRPVHSNPTEPLLDFFLWLGLWILSCPGAHNSTYIVGDEYSSECISNDSKEAAYSTWFNAALTQAEEDLTVGGLVEQCDGVAADFGVHAIKKFVESRLTCIPGGPPVMAALKRCGQELGQVQRRYIHEDLYGKELASRCCAMMDPSSPGIFICSFILVTPLFLIISHVIFFIQQILVCFLHGSTL